MKNKRYSEASFLCAVCAVGMLILIVTQFLPFWEFDGQKTSISGYIWMPTEHENLTEHFRIRVSPEFKVESLVLGSLLQLLVPAMGIILFFMNHESKYVPACCVVCGAAGIWSYISKAVFRMGSGWQGYLILDFALVAAAILAWYRIWKNERTLDER